MVGYKPHLESRLTPLDHGLAGAISGMATRVIMQPFDVLKIRFQLQVEPTTAMVEPLLGDPVTGVPYKSKYTGILQAGRTIYMEEGSTAFWKGHVPAQCLSVVFGIVQFTAFEYLTATAHPFISKELTTGMAKPFFHFLCGGVAGCLSTFVCQPIDIVRTRFVAQGEPKFYNTSLEAVRLMYKEAGVRTFFKGLAPTMLQVFPLAGFQFGFYALYKNIWEYVLDQPAATSGIHETTALKSFICGALSGLCAKTAVYPLDLLKKRLQVQGFEEARKSFGGVRRYNSMLHCISCTVKEEGLRGMYKGLWPSTLKAVGTPRSRLSSLSPMHSVRVTVRSSRDRPTCSDPAACSSPNSDPSFGKTPCMDAVHMQRTPESAGCSGSEQVGRSRPDFTTAESESERRDKLDCLDQGPNSLINN